MKIAIVTTGDEIMAGDIADTNAAWMSQNCWQLGFPVVWKVSVGDNADAIADACKEAAKRADVVLVSGGLGPTVDDITLMAALGAFNKDPKEGEILGNSVGTAPGLKIEMTPQGREKAIFFFFPGVPKELFAMFENFCLPWLKEKAKEIFYGERILKCFGIAEAKLDAMLRDVDLGPCVLSFRVPFPEVWIKVRFQGSDPKKGKVALEQAVLAIRKKADKFIFAEGDQTMSQAIGELLQKRGETMAIAESCTGGALMNCITDIPGASQYFERGVVSYSNESKRDLLGVKEEMITKSGAVSEETVQAMTAGMKKSSGATYAIGISGLAGPSGGSPEKPVGTVFIGLATPTEVEVKKFSYPRDRREFKQLVSATALFWLREKLL
ncbi:MAG: nicotinamide-nucleotide amidohydrolase family protein [Deltaproteobacteria bacterium]|nr:nicotinamide-nucleotide amidohydrolase family protein [Deltaproteobacteria bacterium]